MNIINVDNQYLTYTDLMENTQINRICYVVDVNSSVSRLEMPFYSLLVRTTDGKILSCMIFDVDNFLSMGYKLNALKGKYIRLNCRVAEYRGKLSLRFISCEPVQADVNIVNLFQKKIPNVEGYLQNINDVFDATIGKKLPTYLTLASYPQIYNGFSGGYVKFCWDVLMHCQTCIIDYEYNNFLDILYNTLINYNSYLELCNKINLVSDSDRIELVSGIVVNDNVGRLTRDTVSAVIGLSKPEHIVSCLICNVFDFIKNINSMKVNWDMLRPGGVYECDDYRLLKY